jgi:3-hydroxybutyryl-CoA dehydrogenase
MSGRGVGGAAAPNQTKARIAVIGAGLMGHGIAQVFAFAGHDVLVQDPYQPSLDSLDARIRANLCDLEEDESAAARVRGVATIAEAVATADYVVEAALENLALKQQIFAEVEAHAPADCVLASNTSVIPITQIMQGLRDRSRALGTHWWNPPFLVPLVEVIQTEWSDPSVVEWCIALHRDIGKVPVHVKKDVPGFIGNRLQHALWREAISIVERGIADAETVDTVVKASFGRRLGVLAPLENADLVGTDLALAIHQTVLPDIESRPGPSPLLEQLVSGGKLGFKSGEGFRRWTPEQQAELRADMVAHLKEGRKRDKDRATPAGETNGAAWRRPGPN